MIRSRLANALAALLALAVVAATATATSSPASAATSSHHTMTVMHHTVANPPAINAHRATKTLGTHDLFSSAALSRSPKHADPATPLRPRDIAVLLLVVCPAQAPRGPPPGYELASGTTDAGGDPVNETDPLGLGDWLCDVLGDFDSSCLASNPPPLVRCTEAGYGTANCLNMELNPAYPVVAAGGTAYLESQEPCTSNWAIAGNSLLAAGIVATDAVGGEDADDIWSVDSLSSSGAELNPAAEGEVATMLAGTRRQLALPERDGTTSEHSGQRRRRNDRPSHRHDSTWRPNDLLRREERHHGRAKRPDGQDNECQTGGAVNVFVPVAEAARRPPADHPSSEFRRPRARLRSLAWSISPISGTSSAWRSWTSAVSYPVAWHRSLRRAVRFAGRTTRRWTCSTSMLPTGSGQVQRKATAVAFSTPTVSDSDRITP